jgi:hypothetical protein
MVDHQQRIFFSSSLPQLLGAPKNKSNLGDNDMEESPIRPKVKNELVGQKLVACPNSRIKRSSVRYFICVLRSDECINERKQSVTPLWGEMSSDKKFHTVDLS